MKLTDSGTLIRLAYQGLLDMKIDADDILFRAGFDKSKLYEILESTHENLDGDNWSAELHKDPNHPATDVRFTNSETGQVIEVNYKLGSECMRYWNSH